MLRCCSTIHPFGMADMLAVGCLIPFILVAGGAVAGGVIGGGQGVIVGGLTGGAAGVIAMIAVIWGIEQINRRRL
jgi:hypothetical protein